MNKSNHFEFVRPLTCLFLLMASSNALAYLGPGAGLGMIGSLIAILVVGLVIIFGLVLYPIRVLRRRNAEKHATVEKQEIND